MLRKHPPPASHRDAIRFGEMPFRSATLDIVKIIGDVRLIGQQLLCYGFWNAIIR